MIIMVSVLWRLSEKLLVTWPCSSNTVKHLNKEWGYGMGYGWGVFYCHDLAPPTRSKSSYSSTGDFGAECSSPSFGRIEILVELIKFINSKGCSIEQLVFNLSPVTCFYCVKHLDGYSGSSTNNDMSNFLHLYIQLWSEVYIQSSFSLMSL